jgi:hypothetical protein
MANKRKLKKRIKQQTDILIEDAYYQSLEADEKQAKAMDTLIDDVVDTRQSLLSRIADYPNRGNRAKVKEHFNAIRTELHTHVGEYGKKIGRLT